MMMMVMMMMTFYGDDFYDEIRAQAIPREGSSPMMMMTKIAMNMMMLMTFMMETELKLSHGDVSIPVV